MIFNFFPFRDQGCHSVLGHLHPSSPHLQQTCYFESQFYQQHTISPLESMKNHIILSHNSCYKLCPLMKALRDFLYFYIPLLFCVLIIGPN